MNLYLISRQPNHNYDTYDSAVVAAETPETAVTIHPSGDQTDFSGYNYTWCDPQYVAATYIGVAEEGTTQGVILASFNAG